MAESVERPSADLPDTVTGAVGDNLYRVPHCLPKTYMKCCLDACAHIDDRFLLEPCSKLEQCPECSVPCCQTCLQTHRTRCKFGWDRSPRSDAEDTPNAKTKERLVRSMLLVEPDWEECHYDLLQPQMTELIRESMLWLLRFVAWLTTALGLECLMPKAKEGLRSVVSCLKELGGVKVPAESRARFGFLMVVLLLRDPRHFDQTEIMELMAMALSWYEQVSNDILKLQLSQLLEMALRRGVKPWDLDEHQSSGGACDLQVMRFLFSRIRAANQLHLTKRLLLGLHSLSVEVREFWEDHLLEHASKDDERLLGRMKAHLDQRKPKCSTLEFPSPVDEQFFWSSLTQIQAGHEEAGGASGSLVQEYEASPQLEGPVETVKVLVKQGSSVIVEAAVADLMQFSWLLILDNPEIGRVMGELNLKPADVKVTYEVVATAEDRIMVKMVPAVELEKLMDRPYDLYQPKNNSYRHRMLNEFLNERRNDAEVCRAYSILAFTAAVSTVLAFVVHLGDRHAGNIMITDSGVYFHIDFGFVLGKRPASFQLYGANPPFRLDYGAIVTAITERRVRDIFFPVVKLSFQTLRDHYDEMVAFVADIYLKEARTTEEVATQGPAHQKAQAFLAERLVPGFSGEQAARFIQAVVLYFQDHIVFAAHDSCRACRSAMPSMQETQQVVAEGSVKMGSALVRWAESLARATAGGMKTAAIRGKLIATRFWQERGEVIDAAASSADEAEAHLLDQYYAWSSEPYFVTCGQDVATKPRDLSQSPSTAHAQGPDVPNSVSE
ncbi:PIK1 [Symbiodinium natans]|uniref:PIK1 protein n=1 Tax=Symbiodinium natans TaxID=878477 RepID=A0A812TXB4_9DINO|nr:PIK1 [Symbiodinium natans]